MKIVILDANTLGNGVDLTVFEEFGEVYIYGFTPEEKVIDRIKDVDIIITNKVILNESNLKYADKIKLICLTATGTNNVDKDYTKKNNIKVTNVVGYSTENVAQHTFSLLFYLLEKLAYYDEYVKKGRYINDSAFKHFEVQYHELYNKTWGIIGLGAIGKRVASIAEAFGCNVIYNSTSGKNFNKEYQHYYLDELLCKSDIISIHAPYNQQTDNLITYKEFQLMKKTAILLNLGRGKIINENDLANALEKEEIMAAGIDVLEHEPMKADNPLLKIKDSTKLIITPHIAWAGIETRNRCLEEVKKNIKAFLQGIDRNLV